MIAYARSIPHGKAMTQYTTKNCRAEIVRTNHLTEGLPYMGIWDEMCMHMDRFRSKHARKPIKNTAIDIEVSPTADESRNWTSIGWGNYAAEFVEVLDSLTEGVDRNGVRIKGLKPTNIANSQYFAAKHDDSKSGISHLHFMINRIDMDGNINDCNYIGERAALAAQIINERHGWVNTMDIRAAHIEQINNDVLEILRRMQKFTWDEYFGELKKKGYGIYKPDSKDGKVHGYSICMGYSHYRSSDLGKGREYTAAKIDNTFNKLHPAPKQVLPTHPMVSQFMRLKGENPDAVLLFHNGYKYEAYKSDADRIAKVLGLYAYDTGRWGDENGDPLHIVRFNESEFDRNIQQLIRAGLTIAVCDPQAPKQKQESKPKPEAQQSVSTGTSVFRANWEINGTKWSVCIPTPAYNVLDKECESEETGNAEHKSVVKVAALLFMGYIDAATSISESCGGGGSPSGGWGRDKDDDDKDWARKCAVMANWMCKPMMRVRGRSAKSSTQKH